MKENRHSVLPYIYFLGKEICFSKQNFNTLSIQKKNEKGGDEMREELNFFW